MKVSHLDRRDKMVVELEVLIRKVKAGEIDSVAYAATTHEDDVAHGWAMLEGSSTGLLLGAIRYMETRFIEKEMTCD